MRQKRLEDELKEMFGNPERLKAFSASEIQRFFGTSESIKRTAEELRNSVADASAVKTLEEQLRAILADSPMVTNLEQRLVSLKAASARYSASEWKAAPMPPRVTMPTTPAPRRRKRGEIGFVRTDKPRN